jgi:hypothetical protein
VIGGQSGVTKDIPDNTTVFGCPAHEIKKAKKIEACLSRLPEYIKRLKEVEEKLKEIHQKSSLPPGEIERSEMHSRDRVRGKSQKK